MVFSEARFSPFTKLAVSVLMAAANASLPGDTLVFRDNGDRINGRLVAETDEAWVFLSDRFGEMRVPADKAFVERVSVHPSEAGAAVAATPATPILEEGASQAADAAAHVSVAASSADAAQMAMEAAAKAETPAEKKQRWRVRLAFSVEDVNDSSRRSEWIGELRAERKWARDELRLEPRYEFRSENGRTNADLFKSQGYYRHDFGRWWFAQYLPYYELNRQFHIQAIAADYQFFRNELGGGVRLIDREGSILRVGVAESFYSVDLFGLGDISSRGESVFVEAELDLPWRITLRDRGQMLRYSSGQEAGVANELEITKHLTDYWWVGLRHEHKVNAPELQGTDMTKLRLFLGLDF